MGLYFSLHTAIELPLASPFQGFDLVLLLLLKLSCGFGAETRAYSPP